MAGFNAGSALGGVASGASVGSAFGPIGTGVGAAIGGLTGGLFGGRKKKKKISTMDKQQQALYDEYVKSIMGPDGQFSNSFGYNPEQLRDLHNQTYAQPAYQKFQEEIVPGITGSFRGNNLQNSSYLGGALAKAGTDVQNNLNSNLANMLYQGQQAGLDRRSNAVDRVLNMNTQAYQKPQASPFDSLLSGLTEHAGSFLANKYMPIPK